MGQEEGLEGGGGVLWGRRRVLWGEGGSCGAEGGSYGVKGVLWGRGGFLWGCPITAPPPAVPELPDHLPLRHRQTGLRCGAAEGRGW